MEHLSLYPSIRVQAEYSPEAPAILAPNREPLTYCRLQQHLESVVVQLNNFGIGRNDPVAIVLPNGPEMATAFLAVASCATSAPLNPAYREPEFEFYLSDLNAKALVVLVGIDSPVITVAQAYDIPVILSRIEYQSESIGSLSSTGGDWTRSTCGDLFRTFPGDDYCSARNP